MDLQILKEMTYQCATMLPIFLSKDKERSKRIDGKEKIENFVKVKIVVEWSVCEAADKKLNDPMKEI